MKIFILKKFEIAVVVATLLIIYLFNFVSVYINIVDNRSFGRQILAYALNIAIFTIIFYSIIVSFSFLYSKLFRKNTLKKK